MAGAARPGWALAAALLLGGGGAAAQQPLPASGAEVVPAVIEAALGRGACTRDDQCRVIGIGARTCGGAEAHRAYSLLDVDEARLQRLVAEHAQMRLLWQQRRAMMSTCEVQPEPGVRCALPAGRCVPVPAAGPGGAMSR